MDAGKKLSEEMNMWIGKMKIAAIGMSALMFFGCGTSPYSTSSTAGGSVPVTSAGSATGYGVVQAIDVVQREQAGIGVGAVAGGVAGGVLGSQVGSGTGRRAATVAGIAGGALLGHQMEKNMRAGDQVYRVAVLMDNGSVQTLMQGAPPAVQVGERVRLENGVVVERFR